MADWARELNQVRHHAVLGHGLAVQTIRARGPAGTKVGFAENTGLVRRAVRPAAGLPGRPDQRLPPQDGVGPARLGPRGHVLGPRHVQSIWGAESIFITENGAQRRTWSPTTAGCTTPTG